jgi:TRIAP1/MDM35 family protein
MSSLSPECDNLKKKYDLCFNNWYTEKYLKGYITEPCQELFKQYKECVWKAIREKQIDKLIHDVTNTQ